MTDNPRQMDLAAHAVTAWELVTRIYGPYAFGLISVLLIWFWIVKPELDTRTLDFQHLNQIVDMQGQIVSGMEDTARTMEVTATILERTVDRLDKKGGE